MPVDKSEGRIREMFGEISPRYDFLNHLLSAGADYYWRRRAVRAVPLEENVPVLDVCTGTGDLALAYWKRGRGRVPIVGSDFTHEMLVLANRKSAALSSHSGDASGVSFLEADTQWLPFAENRFQIVSVAFGLRNVTCTDRGLQEMVRVCRPGGHVIVLEFTMPRNRLVAGMYRFYFRRILPRVGQLISGSRQSAYSYLPASVSEFPQGEAFLGLMRASGLVDVTWQRLTFGIASLYCGRKPAITGRQ